MSDDEVDRIRVNWREELQRERGQLNTKTTTPITLAEYGQLVRLAALSQGFLIGFGTASGLAGMVREGEDLGAELRVLVRGY